MIVWRLAALGWLAVLLTGCNWLSGRNVPIGNPTTTARLAGSVVSEQDPTLPIADALVQVVADGTSFSVATDTDGKFILQVPKGKTYQVTVRPPAALENLFQAIVVPVEVEVDDDEVQVVIPLLPPDVPQPTAPALRIEPGAVTLGIGQRQQFRALTDGQLLPSRPVWSVHGKIGVINADGLFTATRAGKGLVRVRLGNLKAEAQVTVIAGED